MSQLYSLFGSPYTAPGSRGFGSPTMEGYGYNWYGGQPQIPEGGYYNQMAQSMAGPSYAPPGSNWYSGGQGFGGKGTLPSAPTFGGKGMQPNEQNGSPGNSLGNVPSPAPFMGSPQMGGLTSRYSLGLAPEMQQQALNGGLRV